MSNFHSKADLDLSVVCLFVCLFFFFCFFVFCFLFFVFLFFFCVFFSLLWYNMLCWSQVRKSYQSIIDHVIISFTITASLITRDGNIVTPQSGNRRVQSEVVSRNRSFCEASHLITSVWKLHNFKRFPHFLRSG